VAQLGNRLFKGGAMFGKRGCTAGLGLGIEIF